MKIGKPFRSFKGVMWNDGKLSIYRYAVLKSDFHMETDMDFFKARMEKYRTIRRILMNETTLEDSLIKNDLWRRTSIFNDSEKSDL